MERASQKPASKGGGNKRKFNREGTPVETGHPFQCMWLLDEELIRILRNMTLYTIDRAIFYKRLHMGMTCFTKYPRAYLYVHPTQETISTVEALLVTKKETTWRECDVRAV